MLDHRQTLASNQRQRNQPEDCETFSGVEMMGCTTSSLKEKQLRAANWKAFVRSCWVLCRLFPPLLKVLARRCLLSFLICNYKDGGTQYSNDSSYELCTAGSTAGAFLNRKLHHSKGFNASLHCCSCLRPRAPKPARQHYSPDTIMRLKNNQLWPPPVV